MVVIVWSLDLQLHVHMQTVHITTDVVSSNLDQGEVHLRQVGGFLRVLRFPPPIRLTATM